jgi:ubiquitin carboxyl-terminal hydrolase L5
VLLNTPTISLGAPLQDFKDFTTGFPPDLRGECLSNSELIRSVHNSFARASPFADETQRGATGEDEDVYHFIAYAPIDGVLYELDGLRRAPISHGACSPAEFAARVVPVLQRRIARYPAEEIRFNLMAMIEDPRIRAARIGDGETLRVEEGRRRAWMWENSLRRHNFVGFVGDLMKGVVAAKLEQQEGEAGYEGWIESGKKRASDRKEALKAAGVKEGEDRL